MQQPEQETLVNVCEPRFPETMPLNVERSDDGVLRIKGTPGRVHTIIGFYRRGRSPEQIAEIYRDRVPLGAIYALLGYYLSKREAMEDFYIELEAQEKRRTMDSLLVLWAQENQSVLH